MPSNETRQRKRSSPAFPVAKAVRRSALCFVNMLHFMHAQAVHEPHAPVMNDFGLETFFLRRKYRAGRSRPLTQRFTCNVLVAEIFLLATGKLATFTPPRNAAALHLKWPNPSYTDTQLYAFLTASYSHVQAPQPHEPHARA